METKNSSMPPDDLMANVEIHLTDKEKQEFIDCIQKDSKFTLQIKKVGLTNPAGKVVSYIVMD